MIFWSFRAVSTYHEATTTKTYQTNNDRMTVISSVSNFLGDVVDAILWGNRIVSPLS